MCARTRELDSWEWVALNQPDSVNLEEFVDWRSKFEVSIYAASSPICLLEEYLCLYYKYSMDLVLTKLMGMKGMDAIAINRLIHYNRILRLPAPSELVQIRESLDAVLNANPKAVWHGPLVCMSCFMDHPVIQAVIQLPELKAAGKGPKMTTKTAKRIRSLLSKDAAIFLADFLKTGHADDVSRLYRLSLILSDPLTSTEAREALGEYLVDHDMGAIMVENSKLVNILFGHSNS